MYSVTGYGSMMADRVRMDAYAKALQDTVKPGSIVVDLGTGTGICAFLACQLGAKRVYAIEPDPIIELAKILAADNGLSELIEFIPQFSTQVTLPEKADVLVSDLRGILPLFRQHIPSLIDARTRFLAPDGVLIPQQDRIWGCLVHAPKLYQQYQAPWGDNRYGLNFTKGNRWAMNRLYKCTVQPEQCVVSPQWVTTLDYGTIEDANLRGELSWESEETTTVHGLVLWFESQLTEGVSFSNAPGEPDLIYGKAFLPWERPVGLEKRDRVTITLKANLVHNHYIWQWHIQVWRNHQLIETLRQSTFYSHLSIPEQ
ncbi:50S ribosomal protein L11 methyltransferase [Spirulina sp. CS-785/01]|uniref:50S ribosomal protein L11 methyltransferase n=1 Tax=Spirulina sp. CS-785/01 TaxID=3021716 RepID=UPI00232BE85E|nr:50S ribosomal protein L11 methyltransferase [Spirulina sp. CS-785/01]MDB9314984.1 50S ribosomal protein L11 methyltransferase [Spirulina sp. CS-785/01]